ncbi:MAG: hypothetical protein M1819_007423 [Sarea resinae]|nr:MAG: hypothetical protein M1819_007423 [Sarea resinae]
MVSKIMDAAAVHVLPAGSHKPRPPKTSRTVRRPEPFDPEELCRRLELYQKQEKKPQRPRQLYSACEPDKRRRSYHHIPQVAAAAFERTSISDLATKKLLHKLSQPVVDRYKNGRDTKEPAGGFRPGQLATAHEAANAEIEALAERNQFQHTKVLEEAALADRKRGVMSSQKANSGLASSSGLSSRQTNLVAAIDDASTPKPPSSAYASLCRVSAHTPSQSLPNDRNDWTQKDENAEEKPSFKERIHGLHRPHSHSPSRAKKEGALKGDAVKRLSSSRTSASEPEQSPSRSASPKKGKLREARLSFASTSSNGSNDAGSSPRRLSFLSRFRKSSSLAIQAF